MAAEALLADYGWSQQIPHTEAYLWGAIMSLLNELALEEAQVLELGCGNGALVAMLAQWATGPLVLTQAAAESTLLDNNRHI